MNIIYPNSTIGILGGLGPETTSHFYMDLIRMGTKTSRPSICIWSLPLNLEKEAEFIQSGKHKSYLLHLMKEGIQSLIKAGSNRIVIPCNTVHEFHAKLSKETQIPIAYLPRVVVKEVNKRNWKRVFLLATSRTIQTKIYHHTLEEKGIDVVLPSKENQTKLDALIIGLLGNRKSSEHQRFLRNMIESSKTKNVILGCTDLQLLFSPSENVIDSMHELAKHSISAMHQKMTNKK